MTDLQWKRFYEIKAQGVKDLFAVIYPILLEKYEPERAAVFSTEHSNQIMDAIAHDAIWGILK